MKRKYMISIMDASFKDTSKKLFELFITWGEKERLIWRGKMVKVGKSDSA